MKLRRARKEPPPPAEGDASTSAPEDLGRRMLPAAVAHNAPLAEEMMTTSDAPRQPRRHLRVDLPPIGLPLAVAAIALAVAAAGLAAADSVWGVLLLPFAGFLLALSAASPMPARPAPASGPATEALKLRLVGLALACLGMLVLVAILEGLAVPAALGWLFSFSQFAALLVKGYPMLLAALLGGGAALRIAAGLWGGMLEIPLRRQLLAIVLGGGSLVIGALLTVAAFSQGVIPVTHERAPFIAGVAVLAGLGALWAACLPSFPQMGDWLARPGLRRSRLARDLATGLGAAGLSGGLAGVALWFVGLPMVAVPVLAAGLLVAMLAGFPAGVARFASAFAHEDPEAELQRRRQALYALLGVSLAGLLVALLGIFLGLKPFLEPGAYEDAFVGFATTFSAVAVGVVIVIQGAVALASPRVPIPGMLGERRRVAAWDLSLAALLLALFGVLLGSGLAAGPGVGPASGLLLLLGGGLASGGHSLLRVVLPPPKEKRAEPKVARTKRDADRDVKEEITRTMHTVYAAGLGLSVLMVALVSATSLGVVDVERSTGLSMPVIVVLLALAGAPFVAWAVWKNVQARKVEVELRRRATAEYKKRLTPEEVSRLTIIAGSLVAAIVLAVFGLLTQFGMLKTLGPFELRPKFSTDFFVFAILVGLGPYGFMRSRELARMQAIDAKFPEFLRDLAESKRAGMTLTQAVITASKGSYGALTPDIRKMAAQIEWGVSFSEALQRFSRRVKTPLIERSVSLIVQASEAGGNVVDILHAAAEDAREIQLLLRERKTAMSIYVMIIYISFFVFLSVIAILDAQFLPEVAKAVSGAQGVSVGPIKFGTIDVEGFEQVFFHAAIIQALGGGFVAGVMSEGRPSGGLRHVFVMVIVGYIAFRFLIGG